MSARSKMSHRVTTERDTAGTQRDAFNQPVTHLTSPLSKHPCYWQVRTEQFAADGDKLTAIASHLMLLPLKTDIQEQDRVTSVAERRGKSLKDTKLRVVAVVRREDHIQAMLEEYA